MSRNIPHEMLIRKENIQLSNVIGQGIKKHYFFNIKQPIMYTLFLTGEFGQVYKGYLKTHHMTDVVAVKTLKGEYRAHAPII